MKHTRGPGREGWGGGEIATWLPLTQFTARGSGKERLIRVPGGSTTFYFRNQKTAHKYGGGETDKNVWSTMLYLILCVTSDCNF